MILSVAIGACALSLAMAVSADTLDFEIGASFWNQNYEGTIQSGSAIIDVENTLGLEDETNNSFYIALEHPIPILPNIMLARTELDIEESLILGEDIDFDGIDFGAGSALTTRSDLSHNDLTLYYEILDNRVSLDVGVTVRQFYEGIELRSVIPNPLPIGPPTITQTASEDLDEIIPLLYVAAKFELPITGLYVGGDVNTMSYDDDSLIDYSINVSYETSFGPGLELGFRSMELEYEDASDEKADVTIDGGYVSVFYHF